MVITKEIKELITQAPTVSISRIVIVVEAP